MILKEIHQNDYEYFDEDEIFNYIKNNIHFFPLYDTNTVGLTDKYSLNSFIFT